MKRLIEQNFHMRQNLIFILGLCLCLYFGYHTLQGERSLPHLLSLGKSIEKQEAQLSALKAQREALEQKVVMLRPGSIDPDFLEERARLVLGFVKDEEYIVVRN